MKLQEHFEGSSSGPDPRRPLKVSWQPNLRGQAQLPNPQAQLPNSSTWKQLSESPKPAGGFKYAPYS